MSIRSLPGEDIVHGIRADCAKLSVAEVISALDETIGTLHVMATTGIDYHRLLVVGLLDVPGVGMLNENIERRAREALFVVRLARAYLGDDTAAFQWFTGLIGTPCVINDGRSTSPREAIRSDCSAAAEAACHALGLADNVTAVDPRFHVKA